MRLDDPTAPEPIYLDNNATTRLDRRVAERWNHWNLSRFANPASQHAEGRRARQQLENAREHIIALLGGRTASMSADRLIFTSGGTEANNLAIFGLLPKKPGDLIVSQIEHPSILESAKQISTLHGRKVRYLPVDLSGVVRIDILQQWLEESASSNQPIAMLSIMAANNETGVIQPISDIVQLCRPHGVLVHTDAVQYAAKQPVSFVDWNVDALTLTAHKFHGPVGIGALLLRSSLSLTPQLFGGFQQLSLRPGTETVALASCLDFALQIALEHLSTDAVQMAFLRDTFERQLKSHLPDIVIHGSTAERLPHTSSIAFPGCDRQALQMALDFEGVLCSTGSACASGSSQPSHVLTAMGIAEDLVQCSVRFSLSRENTEEEIGLAIDRIVRAATRLKKKFGGHNA